MAPTKSPPWTREEIILALDLYFRVGRRVPNPTDHPVIEVSTWLNQLPLHPVSVRAPNFRNPSGVVLKIANLRTFDRSTPSRGMSGGSRLDKTVYEEFEDRPDLVRHEAEAILRRFGLRSGSGGRHQPALRLAAEPKPDFRTGFNAIARHLQLEADMESRANRMAPAGAARCEVCGFDFELTYGDIGAGYIQFHHRVPLRDLTENTRPTADQLHLLCANCHAMLHLTEEPIPLDALKMIVRERQRIGIRALASRLGAPSTAGDE